MAHEFDDLEQPRSRTWLWIVLLMLTAFAGGAVATGYSVTHSARFAGLLHLEPAGQAVAQQQLAQRITLRAPPASTPAASVSPADSTIDSRVGALEDKVDEIETQAHEATGDASRAEGLLVAFAARRALDRGAPLGYIEGLLRQRFGGPQPQAVAAILSASRQPVTLADLSTELDAIAPTLAAGGTPKANWWQSFRQSLAGMVVVRRAGEPSTQPGDRVERAQRMLEAGQVDGALAEILRLPDPSAADKWIPAARRYLAGRGALDQIETAALLDPATSPGAPAAPWPQPTKPAATPAPAGTPAGKAPTAPLTPPAG